MAGDGDSVLSDFVAVPRRAQADRNLTALHHAVLQAICGAVDKATGTTKIMHATIARNTNRPRGKIFDAVRDLEALGYLTWTRRGRNRANEYRINYQGELVDHLIKPLRRPPPANRSGSEEPLDATPPVAPSEGGRRHPPGGTTDATPPVAYGATPPVADSRCLYPDVQEQPESARARSAAADASPSATILPFKGSATRKSDDDDDDKGRIDTQPAEQTVEAEPQTWTDAKGRRREYPPPEGWDPEWHGEWTGQREAPEPCPLPEHARWLITATRNELPHADALIRTWVDLVGVDETRAFLDTAQSAGLADDALRQHVVLGISAALERRDQG